MKRFLLPVSAILSVALAAGAVAQTASTSGSLDFSADLDLRRYSDAPFDDHQTDLAVSVLTEEGVLRGNDDGTFRPERRLNRAEFVQIVMRLQGDSGTVNKNCFPDVSPDVWYADPVCRAKVLGIVRGNARVDVDPSLWRFEPTRDVQYEEALKILIQVYAYPIVGDTEGMDWYVPYMEAAADMGLTIDGLSPGDRITRGEMARLTLAFVAHSTGQLQEYRDAEREGGTSSSSSSSSHVSSSSSSRTSSSSSVSSGTYDPDEDLTVRSNILVLGEVGPVIGAVDFFAASEPVDVDTITVRFASDPSSIQQVRVYAEEDGRLLGTSFRNGSGDYEISIPTGTFILPHRQEAGVYVRVLLKPSDGGATGGQIVRIERIEAQGSGVWSNADYTVSSTETFLQFETAPATITVFRSTGSVTSSVFVAGSDVTLGDFDVQARSTDNDFVARLLSVHFRLALSSDVSLTNVELMVPGTGASTSCVVTSGYVECDSIPSSVGTVDTTQRLRLVGDVAVAQGAVNPFLQVTVQEAGSPSNPGDVTWTDGQTTYDWLPFEEPVARGIRYE